MMQMKKRKQNYEGMEYLEEVKFKVMKSLSENSGFINRPF